MMLTNYLITLITLITSDNYMYINNFNNIFKSKRNIYGKIVS